MLIKQPQMDAWLYEVENKKFQVRIQIDKKHSEYNFIKSKALEVGTIHKIGGEHVGSIFQIEQELFERYYPKFEFLKDKLPRKPRSKKTECSEIDISDDVIKFLSKKAHPKSDIRKKFKNTGIGAIDKLLKDLIKDGKIVVVGIKKAARYKSIIT
jgi:hypothetical protein